MKCQLNNIYIFFWTNMFEKKNDLKLYAAAYYAAF